MTVAVTNLLGDIAGFVSPMHVTSHQVFPIRAELVLRPVVYEELQRMTCDACVHVDPTNLSQMRINQLCLFHNGGKPDMLHTHRHTASNVPKCIISNTNMEHNFI